MLVHLWRWFSLGAFFDNLHSLDPSFHLGWIDAGCVQGLNLALPLSVEDNFSRHWHAHDTFSLLWTLPSRILFSYFEFSWICNLVTIN